MMRRLVIVAVEQHKIVLGNKIGQNDLVRGRGSVENEIGLFGAENRGRLLLRLEGWAFMRQAGRRAPGPNCRDRRGRPLPQDAP